MSSEPEPETESMCQHTGCVTLITDPKPVLHRYACARCLKTYCDVHLKVNGENFGALATCINGGGDYALYFCKDCQGKPWSNKIREYN